ncbi:MAG TPA: hypothetical protein VHZ55_14995 [Bryobacteraceae bacterium]|nr:hypothetical protein [Bryobacteraceae bacterium]
MSPRSIRRAAERRQAKEARKAERISQSTGPRTPEGKQRSSQNSFKHGLYSKALVLPHESAAEFDELRAKLRAEHQPVNTTEEILVDELAQHFWRMRRFRSLEATLWQPATLGQAIDENLLTLATRAAASAERSFHKSLQALRHLQKDRKFVPQNTAMPDDQPAAQPEPEFVPSLLQVPLETWLPENVNEEFVWESEDDYRECMADRARVHQFVSSNREQAA